MVIHTMFLEHSASKYQHSYDSTFGIDNPILANRRRRVFNSLLDIVPLVTLFAATNDFYDEVCAFRLSFHRSDAFRSNEDDVWLAILRRRQADRQRSKEHFIKAKSHAGSPALG